MTLLLVAAILLAWVVLYLLFAGVGVLVARASGVPISSWRFVFFWLGWSATIVVLQIVHAFRRIDGVSLAVFAAAGTIGLLMGARTLRLDALDAARPRVRAVVAALMALGMATYLARHALVPPSAYDSGTYHLPMVEWLNAYPLVAGLGNLHVRLAFNNSVSLYEALLNAGALSGFTCNLSLGLLVAAACAELVWNAVSDDSWRRCRAVAAASALALPFFVTLAYGADFEGLSPDIAVSCCSVAMGLLLLRLAVGADDEKAQRVSRFALLIVAAAACTLKPSMIVFGAGTVVWTVAFVKPTGHTRARVGAALFGTVAIAGWIGRSIVLSGYPLFPTPLAPLPVPWRIPLETARQNYGWVRAWARLVNDDSMAVPFETVLGNWQWLRPWLAHLVRQLWVVSGPLVFAAAAAGLLVMTPRLRRVLDPRRATVVFVPVAALVFWFISAPDVRFAGMLFVVAAFVAVGVLVDASAADAALARRVAAVVVACAIVLGAKQAQTLFKWWRTWPSEVVFGHLPVPATGLYRTESGLTVRVPLEGETCWAAPVPCTPYPSPELRSRRAGDPGSGFLVSPFHDDAIVGWWTASRPWTAMKP